MKIYNQEKTEIIEKPDLKKGYLQPDQIISKIIPAVEAVKEQFHYKYKVYENGGRDRFKIVDVEGIEAKPETYEYEDIMVYIPFNEKQLLENELREIDEWFTWYDKQVAQYHRSKRQGIAFDKNIEDLDNDADSKQIRIREIKEQLKQFETKS